MTKAMEFRGAEFENNLDPGGGIIYRIGWARFNENRRSTRDQELQDIETIVAYNGDPAQLKNRLLQFYTSLNRNFSIAFLNSQVPLT
jgi:hypothetical protein